jgi:hypothetical protein
MRDLLGSAEGYNLRHWAWWFMECPRGISLVVWLIVFTAAASPGALAQAGNSPAAQTAQTAQTVPAGSADNTPATHVAPIPANAPRMSKDTRFNIIRDFETRVVYSRTTFPMGAKGLILKDATITPNGEQLRQDLALYGPSVRPGDPVQISFVQIKDNHIHLDINGGPVRRKKWYQRVQVYGTAGTPVNPQSSEEIQNPHGSYLEIYFDKYVPEMTAQQFQDLLSPVLDFSSHNKEEAYLETVPPKVKQAILAHHVLVGMNSEMVIHAMGKPPKKDRERDGEVEYEEWIYGQAPQDVNFVRFVGDEVVRVETMKVGGEKIVRTAKEVELNQPDKNSQAKQEQEPRPANAPSLRRPGEDSQDVPNPANGASPMPPPPPDVPQQTPPGPN